MRSSVDFDRGATDGTVGGEPGAGDVGTDPDFPSAAPISEEITSLRTGEPRSTESTCPSCSRPHGTTFTLVISGLDRLSHSKQSDDSMSLQAAIRWPATVTTVFSTLPLVVSPVPVVAGSSSIHAAFTATATRRMSTPNSQNLAGMPLIRNSGVERPRGFPRIGVVADVESGETAAIRSAISAAFARCSSSYLGWRCGGYHRWFDACHQPGAMRSSLDSAFIPNGGFGNASFG